MRINRLSTKILGISLAAAMLVTGCNSDDYKPSDYEPEPIDVSGNDISNRPENDYDVGLMAIGERYELDGKMESYLTGEWVDVDVATRRPFAVMIPNNRNSLPQYGISYADVIYEAPMEKCYCTRLMGIFQNYGDLEYIEPVRSSRHYFLQEALSYDAIYCNWGLAAAYVGPLINSDFVDNISASVAGIDVGADEAYYRDKDRQQMGYSLEYTGVMSLEGYQSAVARLGYDTEYPTKNYTFPLQFATDANKAEYEDYPDATEIYPGGNNNQSSANGYSELNPYFVYDPETCLYYRYQNDAPQIDEYNGEQLAVTNVIIKFCPGERLDDSGYMNFTVFGAGEGLLFTNGKVINIKWSRELPFTEDLVYTDDIYAQTRFYDPETEEDMILNKGKTWICIVWDDYRDFTSYS